MLLCVGHRWCWVPVCAGTGEREEGPAACLSAAAAPSSAERAGWETRRVREGAAATPRGREHGYLLKSISIV